MTHGPIDYLIERQASIPKPLPAAWHVHAIAYASATGNTGLMADLASRNDSPPEALDTIVRHPHPRVRVALLRRQTLDKDKRAELIRAETRASVLAQAYKGSEDEVRQAIEEAFLAKPTRVMAEVLLEENGSRPEVAVTAIATLSPRYGKLTDISAERVRDRVVDAACNSAPGLVDAVEPSIDLSRLVLGHAPNLPDEQAARLIPALFSSACERPGWRSLNASSRFRDTAAVLRSVTSPGPLVLAAVAQAVEGLADAQVRNEISLWLKSAQGGAPTREHLLHLAAQGHEEAMVTLLSQAGSDEPLDPGTSRALLDRVGPGAVPRLIGALREPERDILAGNWPEQFTQAKGWDTYDDPAAAKLRVLAGLLANIESGSTDWAAKMRGSRAAGAACSFVENCAPELVREIPLSVALERARGYSGREMGLLLAQAAAKDLSDEGWATYYSLAADWTGTVGELHQACKTL